MLQLKFHIYCYMCIKNASEYICCVENNLLGTSDSNNNTKERVLVEVLVWGTCQEG